MAVVGNTVILRGEFPSTIGDLSQLTSVLVSIYTENLGTLLTTLVPTKKSNGVYEAQYTISNIGMPYNLVYEFSGVLNGYNYLGRNIINRTLL